jgi:hypothetical protein
LIGCFAGACGFGSMDCELIRNFSRCGRGAPEAAPASPVRVRCLDDSGCARVKLHEQCQLTRNQLAPVRLQLQYAVNARIEDHEASCRPTPPSTSSSEQNRSITAAVDGDKQSLLEPANIVAAQKNVYRQRGQLASPRERLPT